MPTQYTIVLEIGDRVGIRNVYDLPPDLAEILTRKTGVHTNPEVAIKKNMNFSIWNIPKYIYTRDICLCPDGSYTVYYERGLMSEIKNEISIYNLKHRQPDGAPYVKCSQVISKIKSFPVKWPKFEMTLEEYQKDVCRKAYKMKDGLVCQGVISLPTGGGKTITASALLGALGQRTLIVCHTCALVNQWIDALSRKCFGHDIDIGKIGEGHMTYDAEHVVVATIQSLSKLIDDEDDSIFQKFGCIVLDECHHVAAPTFVNIIGRSKAKYRFGLTASLKRKDQKQFLMTDVFGPVIAELSYDDVGDRVILPYVTPVTYQMSPDIIADLYGQRGGQPAFDFVKFYKALSNDEGRNNLIISKIKECIDEDDRNYVLVLTKLREHATYLSEQLDKIAPTGLLLGGGNPKERDEIIAKANRGELRIIVGTSIADEGLDIARLNKLVLCVPTAFVEMLKQRVGRIARKCEGKGDPEVIDIIDLDIPQVLNQWQSRRRAYHKLGMDIHNSV